MSEMHTHKNIIDRYPTRFREDGRYIECGLGWNDLINEFLLVLSGIDPGIDSKIFVIKEKFGLLTIQLTNVLIDDIHKLVSLYANKSSTICEICGKPGIHGPNKRKTWLTTLCKTHSSDPCL